MVANLLLHSLGLGVINMTGLLEGVLQWQPMRRVGVDRVAQGVVERGVPINSPVQGLRLLRNTSNALGPTCASLCFEAI